jgi:hypothetical protein
VKKTFNIDDDLFRQAKIRLGLEALVRRAAYQRLLALRGTEPGAQDVPRRRATPAPKRRGR